MFWPWGDKTKKPRRKAIKAGLLIDMQRPPFSEFNSMLQMTWSMAMTKAAFQTFVEVPASMAQRSISEEARWNTLILSLVEAHTERNEREVMVELNVLQPDGFFVPKKLKVVMDVDDDGNDAFNFMLPDETWPVEAPLVKAS